MFIIHTTLNIQLLILIMYATIFQVRIMSKVLGGVSCDKHDCVGALQITDWNIHKVRFISGFQFYHDNIYCME